jgi:hypothetical protein
MKQLVLLSALLLQFHISAQSFSQHEIALTPTVFPKVQLDEKEFTNKILARLPDENKKLVMEYAANAFAEHENFFNSNEAYTNWPEATALVKKVFRKAVPPSFDKGDINIYIIRSPDFNAYCMEDGNILITTGFLAAMNNEAELAVTLSHEYGHYFCNHNFKGFKEKKIAEEKTRNSFLFSAGAGSYYSYLRDAERMADTFAFHFFRTNGYDPEGIASDFDNSNKSTRKYKMLRGYRKIPSYYSTHPPTEERIETAKQFSEKTQLNGKLFQVDSVEFERIKTRAVDECIYLLFQELRFDECLEMAFLQHLFHPNDEFYQYFIVESLKSKMASEKYYGENPFITALYDPGKLKSPKFDPVCRDEKSGEYMHSKYYRMSVFNNLQSPIFSLSAEQMKDLKARNFLNRDTIAFFTNKQALDYFLNILPASGVFNTIRMKYGLPLKEQCKEEKCKSELEKNLREIFTHFKNYNAKWDSMENGMVVLHKVNFYEVNNRGVKYFYNLQRQKNIFHDYSAYADSSRFTNIISEDGLNFRERSKIKDMANFVESIPEENFLGKYVDMDFLDACPELVMQATKNHVETIFIVKLYLYSIDYSQALIYGIDIRNKRIGITKVPLECSYTASPDKIFGKVFGECESMIKN